MIPLILIAAALIPLGSIVLDMALDNAGQAPLFLHRRQQNGAAEIARLTAPLPPRREEVTPVDFFDTWPQRQTPSDLPARVGLVVGEDRPGRHRAPEPEEQQARWNGYSGQFWAIVDGLGDLDKPCTHCATPEDGEPAHVGCPGCACPCTLVGVAHA